MVWKIIVLVIIFYILALLQVSFLSHFSFWGVIINAIFIAVVLINLIFPDTYFGFSSALAGGFFWDVFSSQPFGFHVLILLASAAFIQYVLKKYVRFPLYVEK